MSLISEQAKHLSRGSQGISWLLPTDSQNCHDLVLELVFLGISEVFITKLVFQMTDILIFEDIFYQGKPLCFQSSSQSSLLNQRPILAFYSWSLRFNQFKHINLIMSFEESHGNNSDFA